MCLWAVAVIRYTLTALYINIVSVSCETLWNHMTDVFESRRVRLTIILETLFFFYDFPHSNSFISLLLVIILDACEFSPAALFAFWDCNSGCQSRISGQETSHSNHLNLSVSVFLVTAVKEKPSEQIVANEVVYSVK